MSSHSSDITLKLMFLLPATANVALPGQLYPWRYGFTLGMARHPDVNYVPLSFSFVILKRIKYMGPFLTHRSRVQNWLSFQHVEGQPGLHDK